VGHVPVIPPAGAPPPGLPASDIVGASDVASRQFATPGQHPRRATVVGAGSFGTAVALLLVRAGVRTTLLCRTEEQARQVAEARQNERYLPGVELPQQLKVRPRRPGRPVPAPRRDLPGRPVRQPRGSSGAAQARGGLGPAGMISLAKGLVPPDGGGNARTFVGRGGTGDLVATALAPSSRNRAPASCWPTACPRPRSPPGWGRQWRRSRPSPCWPTPSSVPASRRR
jgi:NAD-dependent glycerol-3-phosphate dehydrogenase N-terminus